MLINSKNNKESSRRGYCYSNGCKYDTDDFVSSRNTG